MEIIKLFIQSYVSQVKECFWIIVLLFVMIWGIFLCLMKLNILSVKMKKSIYMVRIGVLAFAVASVLVMTLFGREVNMAGKHFELELFWSYKTFLKDGNVSLKLQIVNNILLFIPLGVALPLNFRCFEKLKNTMLVVAVISLTIELIQGICAIGLCELDDIVSNVIGGAIGWMVYMFAHKWKDILSDIGRIS